MISKECWVNEYCYSAVLRSAGIVHYILAADGSENEGQS